MLIPKLFEAIRLGNVKSEYVLGDRIIGGQQGKRQVRLKLVAEVVDPGANPLATHSTPTHGQIHNVGPATRSAHIQTAAAPRRGPRRRHPLS